MFKFRDNKLVFSNNVPWESTETTRSRKAKERKFLIERISSQISIEESNQEELISEFSKFLQDLRLVNASNVLNDIIKEIKDSLNNKKDQEVKQLVAKVFDGKILTLIRGSRNQNLKFNHEILRKILQESNEALIDEINLKFSTYLEKSGGINNPDYWDYNQWEDDLYFSNNPLKVLFWVTRMIKKNYNLAKEHSLRDGGFFATLAISALPVTIDSLFWRSDESYQLFCYKWVLKVIDISSKETLFKLAERVAPHYLYTQWTNEKNYVSDFTRVEAINFKFEPLPENRDGVFFVLRESGEIVQKRSQQTKGLREIFLSDEKNLSIDCLSIIHYWSFHKGFKFLVVSRLLSGLSPMNFAIFKDLLNSFDEKKWNMSICELIIKKNLIGSVIESIGMQIIVSEKSYFAGKEFLMINNTTKFWSNGFTHYHRILSDQPIRDEMNSEWNLLIKKSRDEEKKYVLLLLQFLERESLIVKKEFFVNILSLLDQTRPAWGGTSKETFLIEIFEILNQHNQKFNLEDNERIETFSVNSF